MNTNNSLFITPHQLMYLERLQYQGALLKMEKIHEKFFTFKFGPSKGVLPHEYRISCPDYAIYYKIELSHVLEAVEAQRLLLIKPKDLIILEQVNNIKTASYRYRQYLEKLGKICFKYKISINEYAMLNNVTVEYILDIFDSVPLKKSGLAGLSSLEREAMELISLQESEMK